MGMADQLGWAFWSGPGQAAGRDGRRGRGRLSAPTRGLGRGGVRAYKGAGGWQAWRDVAWLEFGRTAQCRTEARQPPGPMGTTGRAGYRR